MPDISAAGEWSIEARAFKIFNTPLSHNFWTLTVQGNVIDQLHGLAIDEKTGTSRAIGNSSHILKAVNDATITWSLQPNQPTVVCAAGSEGQIRERWQLAQAAIPAINALRLHYPNLWQHFYRKNSNTIFNTLGKIMGFSNPSKLLPTVALGIQLVISYEIIEKYSFKS